MKRAFLILLSLALCFGTALAEKASPFYHNSLWNAEDVDLSGVRARCQRISRRSRKPRFM